MDPASCKDKEEFFKTYTEAYGRAKAYQEIIDLLSGSEARINQITKAMNPDKKYAI